MHASEYLILGILALLMVVGYVVLYRLVRTPPATQDASLQETLSAAQTRITQLETEREAQTAHYNELKARSTELEQKLAEAAEARATAQTQINHLHERLAEEKQWVAQANEQLTHQFQSLAQKILEEKSEKFTEQNRAQLSQVIEPLKENLGQFRQQMEKLRDQGARDHGSLVGEIKSLTALNQKLSSEAHNLTQALKGQNKVAGNWGEMILQKVLESSGLSEGLEFRTQQSFKDESGNTRYTDVIIDLPDERHLVIDSKVSLVSYEGYCNAEPEAQAVPLRQHIESLRQHIKDLHSKNYQNLKGVRSPDFVMLFVPVEPALHIALQSDRTLFEFAFEKKIVLVSPTTLLATLKTVANIWRIDKQSKNTEEIARLGGALYDKFVGFLEDMDTLEKHLEKARASHDAAMNKLSTGRGSLTTTAQKLVDLGAKAKKQIDSKLLEE